jgi:hypothetical protein
MVHGEVPGTCVGGNPICRWIEIGALMTTGQIVSIVITILVPIVAVVAGILGVTFQDWRVRRSQVGRRRLALEDARRQVTFAAEWWDAKKLLSDSTEAVQEATSSAAAWLDMASAQVSGSEIPATQEKRRITFRRLLLFYPIQGIAANIIRAIFYIVLGVLVVLIGNTITYAFDNTNSYAIEDLIDSIVLALVALGLRFWAVYAQNSRGKKRRFRWETIRRAFLFYHLGGFMAGLLRVVFYVAIGIIIFDAYGLATSTDLKDSELPATVSYRLVVIGYVVGLRYWAASLGKTHKDDKADNQLPSNTY